MSLNTSTGRDRPDQHRARKRFGQNFLTDANIIDNIIRAVAPKPDDRLIEIGPGKGAITLPLLAQCPSLQVIEVDRDLAARLRDLQNQYPTLQVHEADALTVDFAQFVRPPLTNSPLIDPSHSDLPLLNSAKLRIVGNLPYNISTPLLFHLLKFRQLISDMHFMLQKEVVERLGASANNKSYGRLSVMVQYCAEVDELFEVPPESFSPPPKVNSAVVRLRPYATLPHPADNETLFAKLVATCFQFRRKTLRNSLRKLVDDDIIAGLNIDTSLRPENLSVADYVQLSNQLNRA